MSKIGNIIKPKPQDDSDSSEIVLSDVSDADIDDVEVTDDYETKHIDRDTHEYKEKLERNKGIIKEIVETHKHEKEQEKKFKKNKRAAIKKGPGRPRKNPKKEPAQRKGVLNDPIIPDDFMELLYDQPILFKKLSQFFKLMASQKLQFLFRERDIIIYAPDHYGKSRIRVRIDATKLNHYYCQDTLDIGILTKELEMLVNKIDKDYTDIYLLSTTEETQKTLCIALNNDMQINEVHYVDLTGIYDRMENEAQFLDLNYTIRVELPSKYFKKTINDIRVMSNTIAFTQSSVHEPLFLDYVTSNKKIRSKHTIKNNNKIKLHSNLEHGKSFRVDMKVDWIKPISSAQLSENIVWYMDENKPSMIKAYLDNDTIEITILTEIIDERNR